MGINFYPYFLNTVIFPSSTPTTEDGVPDASEYKNITDSAFCFLPCVLTVEEAAKMHNDNEKISVKNFGRMISFYKEYILTK